MTKYKVINQFKEKNHDNHIYNVGDVYPKQGEKLNKSRAEYLTKHNAEYQKTFLEKIEEVKKVEVVEVELEVGEQQ